MSKPPRRQSRGYIEPDPRSRNTLKQKVMDFVQKNPNVTVTEIIIEFKLEMSSDQVRRLVTHGVNAQWRG